MSDNADTEEKYKGYFIEIIQRLDVVGDELLHPEGRIQGGALAGGGDIDRSGGGIDRSGGSGALPGAYELVRDTIEFIQRIVAEIVTKEEAEAGGTQNL